LPAVLPGAAIFIHHGGIGSVAEGLAAGVPQLIVASAYDQFENGARLQPLGLGQLQPRASSISAVERAVGGLIARRHRAPSSLLTHSVPMAPNEAVSQACDMLALDVASNAPAGLRGLAAHRRESASLPRSG
jgi:rhamnosyltransferase subunit B